ncbi:hypothetical protein M422DRAFT_268234 [Sphaerobolus stellatus SS14]|uniref:Uncharacterized protein n=1 Tax=Sphaerobolus stellatus (strain SS14) TaxID=990650 RepID=A0A0C9UY05_SPHS4|nr:hypothetical protein M422DRAFT_268234 [Sphaerobolus stellatus SS14]
MEHSRRHFHKAPDEAQYSGSDHIKVTIPSVLEEERVLELFRGIAYYPKNTARPGIYLGSDNCPKLSILPSEMLNNSQHSEYLVLTYDQDNILDESTLQALHIQFKGHAVWRSQFETASLLKHFHNIIPISHDDLDLGSSVDGYHLGGVCKLVANFSLESRDFYSGNWILPTSAEENNLKHSTTSKGMRLSFTQSQWQKSDSFLLVDCSYLNNDRHAQLYESFVVQLCHLKEKLKNERPCFQCKLTSLELVNSVVWDLRIRLRNHTKAAMTWPVDEIFLFIDNTEISENGYIKGRTFTGRLVLKGALALLHSNYTYLELRFRD